MDCRHSIGHHKDKWMKIERERDALKISSTLGDEDIYSSLEWMLGLKLPSDVGPPPPTPNPPHSRTNKQKNQSPPHPTPLLHLCAHIYIYFFILFFEKCLHLYIWPLRFKQIFSYHHTPVLYFKLYN